MKKFLVAGLLAVTLLVGFAEKADAESCNTIQIYCGPEIGYAGYGLICFETGNWQQLEDEYDEITSVVCSN